MWLGLWRLAPLSTIFQLYRGDGKRGGVVAKKLHFCKKKIHYKFNDITEINYNEIIHINEGRLYGIYA